MNLILSTHRVTLVSAYTRRIPEKPSKAIIAKTNEAILREIEFERELEAALIENMREAG